jgi:hypothetical protein
MTHLILATFGKLGNRNTYTALLNPSVAVVTLDSTFFLFGL